MNYEIIVVGGGHAGCEAALACARKNHKTLLISGNLDNIADMPCNPSIGGPAKGIVVREIDALGGEMAKNTDKSSLQMKILNTKKGKAVQALRAQADKILYKKEMQKTLKNQENLDLMGAFVENLIVKDGKIGGVILADGTEINAKAVILTTGTYLRSSILIGSKKKSEGPHGEKESKFLSTKLKEIDMSLKSLVSSTENVQFVSNGIDLAIIGKPNVGKSSILNHLTNENKAIVTNIAGTTRDVVYGSIFLNGVKFNLIDTAGIRESDDLVEQIGVTRSKEAIISSDLVVFVLNNNEPITPEELDVINTETSAKKIIFINKCDLEEKINIDKLNDYTICYGNTIEANGLDSLKQTIIELFNLDELKSKNYNYLSNARHIALVKEAVSAVENGIESAENNLPFEMISVDINEAYDLLGEIIGAVYKDELLDTLFSKFCLGK